MSALLAQRRTARTEPVVTADRRPRRHTLGKVLAVVAVWAVGYVLFRGRDTLATPFDQLNGVQSWFNQIRDSVQAALQTNWFFHGVVGRFADLLNAAIAQLQSLFSHPAAGRPVPQVGWLGVAALLTWLAAALAGWRSGLLVLVSVLLFGVLGYWQDSVDTLIVIVFAVLFSLVIGIPTGIAMARRNWLSSALTPVLDIMQTMPSFSYVLPFFMLFGPGATCAIMLTIVYSIPPLVRITEHGIRSVSATTQEAARSLGVTERQLLRRVQLPMARRTIVVGINQCTLAALSMTVIAVVVNGPGLGQDVYQALQNLDVGGAAVPGLLLVVIAIMLDRSTTAASRRSEHRGGGGAGPRRTRSLVLAAGLVLVVVCVYVSHYYLQLARFPPALNVGPALSRLVNTAADDIVNSVGGLTNGFKNLVSYGVLNPLQELLADTPWWLMSPVLLALAFVLGGLRPLVIAAVCEAVIFGMGLWNDTMITLTTTVVATILVMVLAVVVGVVMGRNDRADALIRPVLDAFQTIPSFVYLVPALALFSASRFTAIVAAVAYASPIAVKLVADGIRGVAASTVEAADAHGSTRWQIVSKVQLPMARPALVLATNQGLLYVLSMVVIGGMVGAGSLGYIVVSGFSQYQLFGKGFAAGIAITALGIMLDRVARATAARAGR